MACFFQIKVRVHCRTARLSTAKAANALPKKGLLINTIPPDADLGLRAEAG
ncbi:hypothetical protein B0G80_4682 [Paraburkholderia sp. BL6669N2]|nr:hypothetical protein B0G75_12846 [Paraburkholderia sp. BL18I3N2]PRX89437.1 hypothetical protein B0G73_14711 [Paraburkholderia sp. BL25I1N1]REG48460.1 hypothetical protein B0G80_4682 [Paraburkholderia sp. BL6669N2]